MLKIPTFEKCPRAVALDLDGTLFNSKMEISKRNRRALESCLGKGIPVIVATARAERSVHRYCGQIINDCSVVFANGALARGAPPLSGRVDIPLGPKLAGELIECILKIEPEARVTIEILGFKFGTNKKNSPKELWDINSATPEMLLTLEEALLENPRKIAVGGLDHDLSQLADELRVVFKGRICVIPSDDVTFLNIVHSSASKSAAISTLLNSQGIRLEEVIAFGDDLPDLDMLLACGYPVAMGNAVGAVKQAAKYETVRNDEDGVAVVLEGMLGLNSSL